MTTTRAGRRGSAALSALSVGGLILGLLASNLLALVVHYEERAVAAHLEQRVIDVELAPALREDECEPAPLPRRAAAVLVVGLPGVMEADEDLAREVAALGVGGVLITKTNVRTRGQVSALIAGLRERSPGPLIVTTDEEPGRVSSLGEVLGRTSSARTIARRHTPAEVRALAAETGQALARLGIDVALAPVADLDAGPAGGVIGDRSFSDDPEIAARYVRAYAAGLADGGVGTVVKHFPGHGRSAVDSHRRLAAADASLSDLRRSDLVPFAEAFRAGVPAVMLGHVAYSAFDDELPASLSPGAHDLLRAMGFEGVALTDSVGMGAVNLTWDFPEAAVMALIAGSDAVLATDGGQAERMRDAIVAAVEVGELPQDRLDEAVGRVLRWAGADPSLLVC